MFENFKLISFVRKSSPQNNVYDFSEGLALSLGIDIPPPFILGIKDSIDVYLNVRGYRSLYP